MSILDDSLAQYPEPNYGDDDDITPPRTPDYRCNDDNLNDLVIFGQSEENDAESSPPPSQRRPRYTQTPKSPPKQQRENSPPKQALPKRGIKRKYTDQKSVEAKIAKTELSIEKLEKHVTNWICPKSLQYSAKQNLTPDTIFDRELEDIKLKAEQNDLTLLYNICLFNNVETFSTPCLMTCVQHFLLKECFAFNQTFHKC